MRLFTASMAALLLSAPAAHAQIAPAFDYTGNGIKAALDGPTGVSKAWWQGYIIGPAEYMETLEWICVPSSVTNGQQIDIVEKWLEDNPNRRHEVSMQVVIFALQDAWPCLKKEK